MKKTLIALMMTLALIFSMTACGGADNSAETEEPAAAEAAEEAETAEEPAEATEEEAAPLAQDEIRVDKEAGTVSLIAQVNGLYFDQSTMHCVVFKDGGAGDGAMLAAYADSQDFYNAMTEAGGTPWNTTDAKLEDGEFTDGQKVDVTFTWEGQDAPVALADALKTDDGRPEIDMRFSGNQAGNKEAGSGCIACLNSCWAGITSNAAYAYGAIDAGNPHVYMDDAVMPADGTDVQVTFTLK